MLVYVLECSAHEREGEQMYYVYFAVSENATAGGNEAAAAALLLV